MEKELEALVTKHHSAESGFSRHYLTLYAFVLGLEAKEVLEFGSGFSTQAILYALRKTGGHLTTCDLRPIEKTGNPASLIEEYKDIWTYTQGDSRTIVPQLEPKPLDIVLHDGAHEWWVLFKDLSNILPRIKKNGLVLLHDTEHPSFHLKLIIRLALFFYRYEMMTLPYGYGLTIVRILGNKKNGSISTTWEKNRK